METLLSVEEAARKLGGISRWTIRAWLGKGKLDARRLAVAP